MKAVFIEKGATTKSTLLCFRHSRIKINKALSLLTQWMFSLLQNVMLPFCLH